jgi:D-glycero-alpha-D-manno-heptose-7-phosphate kinase
MNSLRAVLTRSPLRVSFIGGGTDFPKFYSKYCGAFISTSINRYIYSIVKEHSKSFEENYRLNYSETELHQEVSEIKNGIVRATLNRFENEHENKKKLYIGTIGDLRSNSGLGSSSAFACSLVKALSVFDSRSLTTEELANEVIRIELEDLEKPIGIQDQLASAFGGLRRFDISDNGEIQSKVIQLSSLKKQTLNSVMYLVDTQIYRNADDITKHQQVPDSSQEKILLEYLKEVDRFEEEITSGSDEGFDLFLGEFLKKQWENKKKISPSISNQHLNEMYEKLLKCGFLGGKLTGAGGGGYFLMIAPLIRTQEIEYKLSQTGFQFDRPSLTESGTEVLSNK